MHCRLQSYLLIFSFDSWLKYSLVVFWGFFGGEGGYRDGFSETLPETSPMSGKINSIWLQDRSTTVQGSTHQQQWYSL